MYYEATYPLAGKDSDFRGCCRVSSLMGYLQRAAIEAADQIGFGRQELFDRYGAVWMLARSWISLRRPIRWDDDLTIRTWHRNTRSAMLYRDYDIYVGDEWVGESVSGWVFANPQTRKLLHLSDVTELQRVSEQHLSKQRTLAKWKYPAPLDPVAHRLMYYSDCDLNGHVNNTRYADFVQDALHQETRPNLFISEIQINFVKECLPGETLSICLQETNNVALIVGMDGDGKSRFEARTIFSEDIH